MLREMAGTRRDNRVNGSASHLYYQQQDKHKSKCTLGRAIHAYTNNVLSGTSDSICVKGRFYCLAFRRPRHIRPEYGYFKLDGLIISTCLVNDY